MPKTHRQSFRLRAGESVQLSSQPLWARGTFTAAVLEACMAGGVVAIPYFPEGSAALRKNQKYLSGSSFTGCMN